MRKYRIKEKYEEDISNTNDKRELILLGVRADADIKHLNKEIDTLQAELEKHKEEIKTRKARSLINGLDELCKEDEYIEALKFYANKDNYEEEVFVWDFGIPVINDNGSKARKCLGLEE